MSSLLFMLACWLYLSFAIVKDNDWYYNTESMYSVFCCWVWGCMVSGSSRDNEIAAQDRRPIMWWVRGCRRNPSGEEQPSDSNRESDSHLKRAVVPLAWGETLSMASRWRFQAPVSTGLSNRHYADLTETQWPVVSSCSFEKTPHFKNNPKEK